MPQAYAAADPSACPFCGRSAGEDEGQAERSDEQEADDDAGEHVWEQHYVAVRRDRAVRKGGTLQNAVLRHEARIADAVLNL
mgnify:CR=1 FL=1